METSEIFAKRLQNARIMRGLSMDQLSDAMGNSISKMSISKYENCKAEPDSSIVISLAQALNMPVDYFFRPFTLSIDSIKFRKRSSKLGAKQENAIKENIADLVERYINIEEICNSNVEFNFPFNETITNYDYIKSLALELRQEWNLGLYGIVNIINILEDHGIKVLEIDAPPAFDGLSSMVNDTYPVIVLNNNFCSERKRFTALHELGHIVLKFDSSVSDKDQEQLCNLFASEMLIPEDIFIRLVDIKRHDISYQELRAMQQEFGISCDALMYKARHSDIISEQRYRTYNIKKNQNLSLKKRLEESLYPKEESTRFNRLVYKALSNEFITISKAASLLHQSIDQVKQELALV